MLKRCVIFIILSITFVACPEDLPKVSLQIVNNSDEDILWTTIDISVCDHNPWITNSSGKVIGTMEDVKKRGYSYIKRNDSKIYHISKYLEESPIVYYLLSYDSVCIIPWERIRDEQIILKKITFNTWEDFEACNFVIQYP